MNCGVGMRQLIAVSVSGDSGPELAKGLAGSGGGGPWMWMVPAPWRAASPGTRREAPEHES